MRNSLLVVGSVAFDHVITPSGEREESLGGSATYFSYSANYFADVKLVGVVGEDFDQKYIDALNQKGIDTTGLIRQPGKTFRWKGSYVNDLNEAETMDTELNVLEHFNPNLPESYKNCDVVFLANIDPELQLNVLNQTKSPKYVVCDTMNLWINIKRPQLLELLKKIDLFILNDAEAKMLSEKTNLIEAAKCIQKLGPGAVVVKKGEHGSILVDGENLFVLPAYPIEKVVDPTGAGDTFAGGMIGYICKTEDTSFDNLRKAVAYGTIMASFNVENFSMDNILNLKQDKIEKRFQKLIEHTSI